MKGGCSGCSGAQVEREQGVDGRRNRGGEILKQGFDKNVLQVKRRMTLKMKV